MKTLFRISQFIALLSLALPAALAAPLTAARITHIVNDVRTVDSGKVPRPASLNELLEGGKAVRTGINSRTELLFGDQSITRLGPQSHFSINDGTREISLSQGAILLQVPKGAGGAKIQTAAVTAAITGTTIILESGPAFQILTVVEGKCFLTPKAGTLHKPVAVTSGFRVTMPNNATTVPDPVKFDVSMFVKTSSFFIGTWSAQLDQTEISAAIAAQLKQKTAGIGTLKVKGIILVNRQPAKDGDIIRSGDVIETPANLTAIIVLTRGGEVSVRKMTRVRVVDHAGEVPEFIILFGGVDLRGLDNKLPSEWHGGWPGNPSGDPGDSGNGADPLPYLAVFGLGNFPIALGSSSSGNGTVVTAALPGGIVILYDSLGRFLGFQ